MRRNVVLAWAGCLLPAIAILASCGGGGPEASVAANSTELQGSVAGANAAGARVFLDLNNNQAYDAGEPASATADDGTFTLSVGQRSAGELASAMLVAEIPDTARDADDAGLTLNAAGRGSYVLMAPAAASVRVDAAGRQKTLRAVISPLTTLVAAEVAFNGMTPSQAAQAVSRDLGLGGKDPLSDYNASKDNVLRNIARAAAIALGESRPAPGERVRSHLEASLTQLKARLPAVISDLNLAANVPLTASVSSVKQSLAAAPTGARPSIDALAASGNRFIIKFRDSVRDPAARGRAMAGVSGAELRHTFSRALKGFAVTVPAAGVQAFLEAALQDPDVDMVEADGIVTTMQTVQPGATWGLDRTDQRALPLSTTYSYFATGSGVRAYIIDTGIMSTHEQFGGRVASGYTAIVDGRGTDDCNGHGTHVAGTVGGTTWGMAKGVTLVPVRVLDCSGSGTWSGVIAGLDWMVANAVRPAVANMSLGGGASTLVNEAVARAVAAGITVSVAAGNSSVNACNYSPAGEPSAITVGSTTSTDTRSYFSNYGTCVDVFAPGSSITSASILSASASSVLSGTSMASPHVAGLAALYLQSNPTATPAAVATAIRDAATTGKVQDGGAGSPDALLYTDLGSVIAPEPPISSPEPPISSPEPPISSPQPPISSPEPPPPPSISVAALSGNAWVDGRGWRASVTVAVKNASNNLVPGVVVKGKYTAGGSRLSCTTASNGTCVINSGKIGARTLRTQFSVTALVLPGTPYNPNLNVATTVVVNKP